MFEKKIWGSVWHIFTSDQSAVSYLSVEKGFMCSRHLHKERANLFAVITGSIAVQVWSKHDKDGTRIMLERILGPGETSSVTSGLVHRFRVLESGQVIEVYSSDVPGGQVRLDDIERFDTGGPDGSIIKQENEENDP